MFHQFLLFEIERTIIFAKKKMVPSDLPYVFNILNPRHKFRSSND
jgi:hypothetical protein